MYVLMENHRSPDRHRKTSSSHHHHHSGYHHHPHHKSSITSQRVPPAYSQIPQNAIPGGMALARLQRQNPGVLPGEGAFHSSLEGIESGKPKGLALCSSIPVLSVEKKQSAMKKQFSNAAKAENETKMAKARREEKSIEKLPPSSPVQIRQRKPANIVGSMEESVMPDLVPRRHQAKKDTSNNPNSSSNGLVSPYLQNYQRNKEPIQNNSYSRPIISSDNNMKKQVTENSQQFRIPNLQSKVRREGPSKSLNKRSTSREVKDISARANEKVLSPTPSQHYYEVDHGSNGGYVDSLDWDPEPNSSRSFPSSPMVDRKMGNSNNQIHNKNMPKPGHNRLATSVVVMNRQPASSAQTRCVARKKSSEARQAQPETQTTSPSTSMGYKELKQAPATNELQLNPDLKLCTALQSASILVNRYPCASVSDEASSFAELDFLHRRRYEAIPQTYEKLESMHDDEWGESQVLSKRQKLAMKLRGGQNQNSSTGNGSGRLMRSKSQSRAMLKTTQNGTIASGTSQDQTLDKSTDDLSKSKIQEKFLMQRSKTSTNLSSALNSQQNRWPSMKKLASVKKKNHQMYSSTSRLTPYTNDASAVLELFNPVENERRRLATEKKAMLAQKDRIGFDMVQQELKSFGQLKELSLGRYRLLKIADLPKAEEWNSLQIMKRYQCNNNSLQRPKKKALHEYYNDDDKELEALAVVVDPNAPKPEGSLVTPARGDFPNNAAGRHLQSMQNQPRSIDSILHRYGTTQPKAIAGTVLDHTGKPAASLTYGKLLSRATKVAYMLLTKQVTIITSGTKEKVHLCLPGDRVAIVYPNTEPLSFLTAFYGCLLAGVVPVPIEVPLTKRDAGIQQFGFLLGSCGVRVALTSEACLKGLPKTGQHSTSTATPASNVSMSAGVASPSSSLGPSTSFSSSTTGSGGSGHSANSCNNQNYYNHYAPSTNPNDVAEFKGWPRLHWVITENLPKPSRDWTLPSLLANDEHAYVEYATDREGSVKGVCVSRQSMMAHCRAIVAALGYKEGETIVSVLDFKRDVGLWHTVLAAIYNGMRVHFVPYSLMKINPTSWLAQVTKFQATAALVKSRDLHWSLMATRDHKDLELSSLRTIVVADGSNPWSLSSCDQFLATFQPMGLNPNVLCPCAGSPETGTVSIRRPPFPEQVNGSTSNGTTSCSSGRGILSMLALSHSVVRVDQENSLTSLTLQDAGQVIPGGIAIVVRPTGPAKLCKADEVGEIALHAPSTASCYFGLKGVSQQTFGMSPLGPDDRPLGPANYVRSGLIGFLGPEGLVFVIGNKTSLMSVSGRQHSADDLIATVLAVEPMKFIYRGRIAVFSVRVLRDERICIVAEQKSDVSEEDSFNWMVRVLHAIDSIHQVGVYCLALVSPNQLPKTPLGGIHVTETRQRFLDGNLHPTTLLMCPQNCVLNLPKPRETHSIDVGPAAMFVGNIVQGVRIAGAQGRELTTAPDESIFLIDILRQRAVQTPDHVLFTLINAKGMEVDNFTCQQLLKKSERIGALLLDKGHLSVGDHVALIFPPGLELIAAFYGCLAAGLVPVCIRAPSALNLQASLITVRMVVDVSKSVALLSNSAVIKLLKSKEASHRVNTKAWPTILDIDDMPSSSVARRRNIFEQPKERRPSDTCYLDFSVSTTGQLAGIVITAMGASMQCKSLKVACELYPSRNVTLCLDPCCGLGFTLWCLSSVYSGHQSTLISPAEVEQNASVWLTTLSQHKVRDTFCSYSVMEMCVRELAPQILQLKEKGVNLSSLRTCMAVAEERPRVQLCNAFLKLFAPLGLSPKAVSTSFGTRVNTAICLQGASSPDPTTVYVDARALRNDRVTLVEKGSPHSIPLMESGKLLPGTKVVIANPETKGQCADSHLGEIWVASQYNAAGYYSIFGEETHLHTDHFTARLKTGDTKTVFARTGYLGFLRQTQSITADGELHDAVFVVGSLDETVMLRGMRYHPVDIETTVVRSHKRICESAVFTWTHLLVVVAETDAPEAEALDLVPAITSAVLEEHHLIVGVVMLVDANSPIPINSRGEKQRMHLRDSFLKDQLDPIYVAYNM